MVVGGRSAALIRTHSPTYLLPTVSAVFLGTAVIRPGRFNPLGTLIGVYFLETGILGLEELNLGRLDLGRLLRRRADRGRDAHHLAAQARLDLGAPVPLKRKD